MTVPLPQDPTPGEQLTAENEGCTLTTILDTLGKPTLGRGRHIGITVGQTCTQDEADDWFLFEDYPDAKAEAARVWGSTWPQLDSVRQDAFIDMNFEMGEEGTEHFHVMLAAGHAQQWQAMHDACLASLYDRQVPVRAGKIAMMFLTGAYPT